MRPLADWWLYISSVHQCKSFYNTGIWRSGEITYLDISLSVRNNSILLLGVSAASTLIPERSLLPVAVY